MIGYQETTLFGGFMSVIMVGFLFGYLVTRVATIYTTNEYSYEKIDMVYTTE